MSKSELLRETLSTLRQHGSEPRVVQSKHFKIRWQDQAGRSRCLVLSSSPSCPFAIKKNRAVLRRLLRRSA